MITAIHIDRETIADFCRRWKIRQLSLFGSVLRRDFAADSDVDVLIQFADDVHWSLLDSPAPQGVYARTKLEGEQNAAVWEKHFIVRTSGLYGNSPRKNNFVETMLRLGRQRDRLQIVNDQWCTPSYVEHVGLSRKLGWPGGGWASLFRTSTKILARHLRHHRPR